MPGLIAASGLDDAGQLPPLPRREAAAKRADDTRRQGMVETEWIPDGEGRLPDLEIRRGTDGEGRRNGAGAAEAKYGEIVARRSADDRRRTDFTRGKANGHRPAPLGSRCDHVIVGDHMPSAIPDEARTRLRTGAAFALLGVGAHQGAPLCGGLGEDMHDRWARTLEQRRGGHFRLGQIPPRRDRPRGFGREQEGRHIGLPDIEGHEHQGRRDRDAAKAVRHVTSLSQLWKNSGLRLSH